MKNIFKIPVIPGNDEERIKALKRYQVLDTAAEPEFDNLIKTAARIFDTPIAFISMVDKENVFFKAQIGTSENKIEPRTASLSSLAILNSKPTVLRDISKEHSFFINALPTHNAGLQFFAAAPIPSKDGFLIGAFCIADIKPRDFSERDTIILEGLAGIALDELEQRLSCIKETERYELAAKATHDAIWEWNAPADKIWWNEEFRELFGYEDSYQLKGINFFYEHFFDGDNFAVRRLVEETFACKKDSWQGEFRFKTATGQFIHVLLRAHILYTDGGEPGRMIVSMMNINDRIEANERKTLADTELLRQKDEFISIASHELKTPITSVKGYSQILMQQMEEDAGINPSFRQFAGMIHKQADKMAGLVKHLLDVSRIQDGKLLLEKENFDIAELAKETVHEMQHAFISHNIEINGPGIALVNADRFRIKQVLTNLISNAIKYSPGKEKVIIYIGKNADGTSITTLIKDFGGGIPAGKISQLFEKFSPLTNLRNNQIEGIGLGLYISMNIIQQHGSTITVNSDPANGSEFSFKLPAV